MFSSTRTTVRVIIGEPKKVTTSGVRLGSQDVEGFEKVVSWNTIVKARLTMDARGNMVSGTLKEGDAEMMLQQTQETDDEGYVNWGNIVKMTAHVLKSGVKYRPVSVKELPRGFWYVGLQQVRGN
jgi:hypothetical protein